MEVISDNLSQPCYYIINGDCLNQKASCKAMRYRPLNIWQGNGASVVVRARESLVHGKGRQLVLLIQLTENVKRHYETSRKSIKQSIETQQSFGLQVRAVVQDFV